MLVQPSPWKFHVAGQLGLTLETRRDDANKQRTQQPHARNLCTSGYYHGLDRTYWYDVIVSRTMHDWAGSAGGKAGWFRLIQ
jgi:hypothetical protein